MCKPHSCGEWRCRAHCKCNAPPAPRMRAAQIEAPSPPQPLAIRIPSGRPAAEHTDIYYNDNAWWGRCIGEIGQASIVLIGSYMYDDATLHAKLLARLRGRLAFTCDIIVDKQTYEARSCPGEYTKLHELKAAGASVYLCSGDLNVAVEIFGRNAVVGYFHVKAIAIDGKIAYHGSANFTKSSRKNVECVARYVGKPALDMFKGLGGSRDTGEII
jgi:hypothetical protein